MKFEDILQHPERAKIYTPKLAQKLKYKLRRAKYIHLVERVRSKERGTQFQIKSAKLRGVLKPFKEIYIAKPCDLFLIVTYHNSGRSARALVTQKILHLRLSEMLVRGLLMREQTQAIQAILENKNSGRQ